MSEFEMSDAAIRSSKTIQSIMLMSVILRFASVAMSSNFKGVRSDIGPNMTFEKCKTFFLLKKINSKD